MPGSFFFVLRFFRFGARLVAVLLDERFVALTFRVRFFLAGRAEARRDFRAVFVREALRLPARRARDGCRPHVFPP